MEAVPGNDYALKNIVYINPDTWQKQFNQARYVDIKGFILVADQATFPLEQNKVALNKYARDFMQISKIDSFPIKINTVKAKNPLATIEVTLEVLHVGNTEGLTRDGNGAIRFEEQQLIDALKKALKYEIPGKQQAADFFVNKNQQILFQPLAQIFMLVTVDKIDPVDSKFSKLSYGVVDPEITEFTFKMAQKDFKSYKIISDKVQEKQIFKKNFNFQELGIGGLDKEFEEIFRRAFNSRRYPQHVLDKYGMKHARGMLMYGPPGTGKTLIARQIAKALDVDEPKLVNGPEIFDKYVGGSEKKVRDLFADAERDYQQFGDESKLHIIIFDEIDAICRSRGSAGNSGTGVNETVVNQLLSKIDGVESLNNILVIGMTNRKDMIDEAMLRPGRLEIQLEISLPDEKGRIQIFQIHTKQMSENKLLAADVDLKELALLTKNYTGAEIESVCRSAVSFTLFRESDISSFGTKSGSKQSKFGEREVTMADFKQALQEVKPAFGVDSSDLETRIKGGIIPYSDRFNTIYGRCLDFIKEVRSSQSNQLLSILLEGQNGSGKTALAVKLALESNYPFVKMISPENFVGYHELSKINALVKIFEDAYKSPLSLIVLDDIERLIEFIHIGPRFSNPILQALLVLIKKKPPNPNRKLMIIGTTSMKTILDEMDIVSSFNVTMHLPTLNSEQEFSSVLSKYNTPATTCQEIASTMAQDSFVKGGMPIKDMILAAEMAIQKSEDQKIETNHFLGCLESLK